MAFYEILGEPIPELRTDSLFSLSIGNFCMADLSLAIFLLFA